jgi:hypothetical protein
MGDVSMSLFTCKDCHEHFYSEDSAYSKIKLCDECGKDKEIDTAIKVQAAYHQAAESMGIVGIKTVIRFSPLECARTIFIQSRGEKRYTAPNGSIYWLDDPWFDNIEHLIAVTNKHKDLAGCFILREKRQDGKTYNHWKQRVKFSEIERAWNVQGI